MDYFDHIGLIDPIGGPAGSQPSSSPSDMGGWGGSPSVDYGGGWGGSPFSDYGGSPGGGGPFADNPTIDLPGLGSFPMGTDTRALVDAWRDFRFGDRGGAGWEPQPFEPPGVEFWGYPQPQQPRRKPKKKKPKGYLPTPPRVVDPSASYESYWWGQQEPLVTTGQRQLEDYLRRMYGIDEIRYEPLPGYPDVMMPVYYRQGQRVDMTKLPPPPQPPMHEEDHFVWIDDPGWPGHRLRSYPVPPEHMIPGTYYGSGSSDIDELRSAPWTTAYEQAAIARADELVNERYKALREQKARELAARGITPGSGLWEREMGRIDRDAAREMADFRRNLLLKSIDLRQQRLAQARAIEAMMESMERQRLFDLLSILSGNPNYAAAAGQLVSSLAPLLGQQAAMFGGAASQSFGNLGDLFALLLARNQMQQPQINI